ncbi:MAG: LCP family protein [Firmicutes bacterium]|nr:LCP family protein [Bacillota bacterium]
MKRRDKDFTEVMTGLENADPASVSGNTTLYDAADFTEQVSEGTASEDIDTEVINDEIIEPEGEDVEVQAEETGLEGLPSEEMPEGTLDPADAPKVNPFVRFGRWVKSWKMWVKIVALVCVLALMTGTVLGLTAYKEMEDVVKIMNSGAEIPDNYDLSITPINGFINILVLGTDSRDMNSDEDARTDMIMIASINVETHEVTLTSVYRDTMLKMGDTSTYDKITHAFFYGTGNDHQVRKPGS